MQQSLLIAPACPSHTLPCTARSPPAGWAILAAVGAGVVGLILLRFAIKMSANSLNRQRQAARELQEQGKPPRAGGWGQLTAQPSPRC